MHVRSWLCLCVCGPLVGCASINWEKSFYDGQRQSADLCRAQRDARAAPCATLPDHARYEAERLRIRGAAPRGVSPAEETP